jgi:hypothetical protein
VPARFDWLQHLAERFSLFIDALSRQLSTVLGSWSRQPLLLGIAPSKILLGLFVLAMGLALAGIARLLIWKLLSLSRVRSITERYWRNDILFAIRRALTGFFIYTAAFFACVPRDRPSALLQRPPYAHFRRPSTCSSCRKPGPPSDTKPLRWPVSF